MIDQPAHGPEQDETIAVLSSSELLRQLAESREQRANGQAFDAIGDRNALLEAVRMKARRRR